MAGQSGPCSPWLTVARGAADLVSVSPDGHADAAQPEVKSERGAAVQAWPATRLTRELCTPSNLPGRLPALLEGHLEHQLLVHRHRQPGIIEYLPLELARLPAGVAQSDEGVARTFAAGHGGQHVARGRDLDEVGDLVGRIPFTARADAARNRDRYAPARRAAPAARRWPPASASSFICASTSPSFMSRGLFSTMPSAPLSLCSQIRVTLCAKLPSASEGIATSRLLASEVVGLMSEVWGRPGALSRGCASARARP